jgi:hypothetical protein
MPNATRPPLLDPITPQNALLLLVDQQFWGLEAIPNGEGRKGCPKH